MPNFYATLADYKAYKTARGQTSDISLPDDAVIEMLLGSASDYLDGETGRHFNPYVETRYFSVPGVSSVDPRFLELDDDLLEVLSITNGDGVAIPSTEYALRPRNQSPYRGIRLVDNSTYYWASDGAGDTHDVIAVNGLWGFHNRYAQAWTLGSTANEAMDATETGYDVTSGTNFSAGQIIRFDNELGYVSSITQNAMVITRGENYSTATTHLTGINIYIWQPMREARTAVCEIANTAYRRRFGQNTTGTETITAAGVVLSPRDVPTTAQKFIERYRQYT